jgi:HSP20 family molecular chaperone IbpA
MDVYKGPEAIAKFGAKYKHGVVIVKLKKSKK